MPIVRVLIRSVIPFFFYLPFDDVGIPFDPLAAMFSVARQPGNADSV